MDHNHLTKAEATTGNTHHRNQAHQNYHKMLDVCLNSLVQCQMGHDSRINNVQLIFGNKAAIRDIKQPKSTNVKRKPTKDQN